MFGMSDLKGATDIIINIRSLQTMVSGIAPCAGPGTRM